MELYRKIFLGEVFTIVKIIQASVFSMTIFLLSMWLIVIPLAESLFRGNDGIIAIYWAAVLLSGWIVGCTVYLASRIESLIEALKESLKEKVNSNE